MTNLEDSDFLEINISDFGVIANSGKDVSLAVQSAAYYAAEQNQPVKLNFPKGKYDFFYNNAVKLPYYISNTTSEDESPDAIKTIGLFLNGMKNIIVDGNDSLFIFHGKMTTILIDNCEEVEIKNVNIDFKRATMSEMKVIIIGEGYIDFKVNDDSTYIIENEKLIWIDESWQYTDGHSQIYDPTSNSTWRAWNPGSEAVKAEEIEPFIVRMYFNENKEAKVGQTFQMREGTRDQVGVFIHKSKNIQFNNVSTHYMHGLGIVGQYSENLSFHNIICAPRKETGRTASCFADGMHFSGCKGKISILNSRFSGLHDDPINVHGTHLKIIKRLSSYSVLVRFMHPQTYGFDAFFSGDEVEFVEPYSLNALCSGKVKSVDVITPREFILTFEESMPESIELGIVIENTTWTPEVEVRGCHFSNVPTRGILVTTRKKIAITDNTFDQMIMSAILVADDAISWYESGPVRDVLISNNHFIDCGEHVVRIMPESDIKDSYKPIHSNICVENNTFELSNRNIFAAKSVQGLKFINNTIKRKNSDLNLIMERFRNNSEYNYLNQDIDLGDIELRFRIVSCTDVEIAGNYLVEEYLDNDTLIKTPLDSVRIDENHGINISTTNYKAGTKGRFICVRKNGMVDLL
jgi:hypothetical protein